VKKHSWLVLSVLLITYALSPAVSRADFVQTNLVSDIPGLAPGQPADPNLINPWGMSFSGSTPMWVSNQGSNTATLYNALASPIKQGLTVTIPTGGLGPPTGPTGQVFNSTASDFMIPAPSGTVKATFLFDTLQGTIEGWNPGSNGGTNNAEIVATTPGAIYTGLALGSVGTTNYLYTANATGSIQVFDSSFTNVTSTTFAGKFVDPSPVAGFTPYNIQNLGGGFLYVTYAAATSTGAPLPGGYVDKFDSAGNFAARIATDGALNAPWGLAIAPSGFGSFGGDLLVGNLFNSKIDAYNLTTLALDGSIQVNTGFTSPVGLWALDFGNGVTGNTNTLYFTAGVNDQRDGLFGDITSAPEPGSMAQIALGLTIIAVLRKWSLARSRRTSRLTV
jgi:uncharacterized protein (TIGR03118 family)